MAFVLDPVVSAFLGWAINPLVRQVGYVVQVRRKVEGVDAAMANLKARSSDLEAKVEAAEGRGPTTRRCSEVDVLLGNVRKIEAAVNATVADYEQRCKCVGGCLGNPYFSYKIGRRATKDQEEVLALFEQARALLSDGACVTLPLPPPPGQHMPGTTNLVAMDSHQSKVLKCLADAVAAGEPRTVGIYGMGGVGKTTLLRAINNTLISPAAAAAAADVPSFGHVIFVDVTRNVQVHEVQERIAKCLELPLAGNPDSRWLHNAIFNFLNKSSKRFVLLLDDIWEPLDLDEIGIPDGRRMVVFTTRSEAVCDEMQADERVKVECLSEEAAWQLFKSKVGEKTISSSAATGGGLARKIAAACRGLPLALVVLGTTMSSKRTRREWQHALTSLRKSPGRGTSSIQDPIFTVLKYSYDHLGDEAIRQCFLFCALIPNARTLERNMLIEYLWGHGLIDVEDCSSVDEIYDLGYSRVIGPLKSACLLDFDDRGAIRVHDILVDMASWIACDCGRKKNTAWVDRGSLGTEEPPLKGINDWEMAERLWLDGNAIEALPMPKRRCEKLQTLVLRSTFISTIPESYFQYFPALSYLDLSWANLPKLPDEVSELSELRYLDLSFSRIELLSMNLIKLKKLAHLRLSRCYYLNHIPFGLISGLQMLQFLDLFRSKYIVRRGNLKTGDLDEDGSAEEEDITNKRARELGEVNLDELKTLTEQGRVKSLGLNLEIETTLDLVTIADDALLRWLKLTGSQDSRLLDLTLFKVARDIEVLELSDFQKLEELRLTNEQLDIGNEMQHTRCCFDKLHDLSLLNLHGLTKTTWKRETLSQVFPSLRELTIHSCHGLQNLTWTGCLPCLNRLNVEDCDGLEEIIRDGEINVESSCIFPQLSSIYLYSLPKLHSISDRMIDCPGLINLTVIKCPGLKRIPFGLTSQINTGYFSIVTMKEWWENLECDGDCSKSHLARFVVFRG